MCNKCTSTITRSVTTPTPGRSVSSRKEKVPTEQVTCVVTHNQLLELNLVLLSILKKVKTSTLLELNSQLVLWNKGMRKGSCANVNNFKAVENYLKNEHPEYFNPQ